MKSRDIFISHAEEDGEIALGLARELRAQGQSTWIYEEDAVPGISHLIQSSEAIEACNVFLLVASTRSVQSPEVISEVEQAHQLRKVIVPVRVGLTQEQFTASNRILRMATGTTVTLTAKANDLAATATRIAGSLPLMTTAGMAKTEPRSVESRLVASSPMAILRRAKRAIPGSRYTQVVIPVLVVAAVIVLTLFKLSEPVKEAEGLVSDSPASAKPSTQPKPAPDAELIALLEMRAEQIVQKMDTDLVEALQSIRSGRGTIAELSSVRREQEIIAYTEKAKRQRQLFLNLHHRHIAAIRANRPIVAHEIAADIYQLLAMHDNERYWKAFSPSNIRYSRLETPPIKFAREYPTLLLDTSGIGFDKARFERIEQLLAEPRIDETSPRR